MSEPKAKYTIATTTRTKTVKMCECGATVPKVHFEIKTLIQESTFTAHYFQFEHCAKIAEGWTEMPAGNVWTETWRALSMTGPTGSGYLS